MKNSRDDTRTSRYLCRLLRHEPELIGLRIDAHGWADVDELIAGVSKTHVIDRDILNEIVANDAKGRYSFSEDGTKIRCNQGHSIPVDLELEPVKPPEYLYHGTADRNVPSIDETGIQAMGRNLVHLSENVETARNVGARHGKPFVYRVIAGQMYRDGFELYKSENGVWLTPFVPREYLEKEY